MMKRAWSRPEFVGALLLSLVLATAWACGSGGGSSATPTAPAAALAPTDTAVPCTDENAIGIVRRSVVRISTDVAVGTGIVVGDNQILTNAHVVEDSDKVRVESQDGASEGTVVGTDTVVDLALIQAATHALPAVKFAEPSSLKAGQRLLAIGYALDLPGEPSTTGGIFSALREIDGVHYVQTDAPINPGNSGGPLFTQCGEVVGLNTLGNRAGIGFAIDSSALRTASGDLTLVIRGEKPTSPGNPPEPPPPERGNAAPPPADAAPTETPVPPHCGDARSSVTLVGASPVGRTFRDADRLALTADYTAPDCTEYEAVFYGYHRAGSPWYDYWCVTQHVTCGATLPGVMYTGPRLGGGLPLPSSSGRLATGAVPGTVPPRFFGAPPALDGFYVCGAVLTIYDVTGQIFGVKDSGAPTNGATGLNLGQVAGQPDCSPP